MKIHNIKVNGYGNIKNKEIKLDNKINIIYGKNESGKSTFFKFIVNMLYGASKNKKGRDISDIEKYTPWDIDEFSGKIEYSLDNGAFYNIYREFKKKSPIIYNENGEDISHKYTIDKNNGNQFFYEQTKIDEELFLSSTAVMQQEVKMDSKSKNSMIQKLSNIAGSGNDNISYKKCIDILNKRQLTEIGTERSQDRPLNRVNSKIEELKENIKELLRYQEDKYLVEEKIDKIREEIKNSENKLENLKELTKLKQMLDLEEEKIKINTQINESNKLEIKEIEESKKQKESELLQIKKNTKININKNLYLIIAIALIITNIVLITLIKNNLKYLSLVTIIILGVIYLVNLNNAKKKNRKLYKEKIETKKAEIEKINTQLEVLYKNKENVDDEIQSIKNELEKNMTNKSQIISAIYQLEEETKKHNDLLIKLHMLEVDKSNIYPKLDNLANIEEVVEKLEEEKRFLEDKNKSINLAKSTLEEAYNIMKQNITPKFAQNLSDIICEISNGKYNKIKITQDNDIVIEIESGKYKPIELLSTGTIDQLYLALRISLIQEITGESMPIILDEAFAYYDDTRLENILKYISNNIENQIIILTCTNREKEIYDKLNIRYNDIQL